MGRIEDKVIKEVTEHKNRFFHDERVREFEKMNEKFEELVKKGIAKKRGNQLLSASDAHLEPGFRPHTPKDIQK